MFLVILVTMFIIPLVWLFTDPRTSSERLKAYFQPRFMKFSVAEALVVLITLLSGAFFPWPRIPLDKLMMFVGLIIYLIGLSVAVWAKLTMKSSWGMPVEHDIKRQNKIIKKGPFAFSRNPIYLGLILVVLGASLALRSYSIFLVPFIAWYFYQAALKEEKNLTKYFGKDYLEYKSKVRRFI